MSNLIVLQAQIFKEEAEKQQMALQIAATNAQQQYLAKKKQLEMVRETKENWPHIS